MTGNVPLAVRIGVERGLERIEQYFKRECKLTLIVRTPGDDEAEFLFTRDDLAEVGKALERFANREDIAP